jgi:hypothetical protein
MENEIHVPSHQPGPFVLSENCGVVISRRGRELGQLILAFREVKLQDLADASGVPSGAGTRGLLRCCPEKMRGICDFSCD